MAQLDLEASVDTPTADYDLMEAKRHLPRLLMGGTPTVIEEAIARELIPKLEQEDQPDYEFRRDHLTVLDPYYSDAVSNIVAGMLAEDITLASNNQKLKAFWNNVDQGKRDGHSFWTREVEETVAVGLSGVLVDYTRVEDGQPIPVTVADGNKLNRRPYWKHFDAHNVIETDYDEEGNLRRVRLREWPTVREGEFGKAERVKRVRVLRRGNPLAKRGDSDRYSTWQLYHEVRKEGGKTEWMPDSSTPAPVSYQPPNNLPDEQEELFVEVPFFVTPGRYVRPGLAFPVLEHLAWLVRLYLLKDSDRNNIEHFANVPRRFVEGMSKKTYLEYQGGKDYIAASNTSFIAGNAKIGYYEHAGAAIGALAKSQAELQQRIRVASTEPMLRTASPVERTYVRAADEKQRLSRFKVIAFGARDTFQGVMALTLAWLSIPPSLFESFRWPAPDPSSLFTNSGDRIESLMDAGHISTLGGLTALVKLGDLPDCIDPKEEARRVIEESQARVPAALRQPGPDEEDDDTDDDTEDDDTVTVEL